MHGFKNGENAYNDSRDFRPAVEVEVLRLCHMRHHYLKFVEA